jgi:hypothetical protein
MSNPTKCPNCGSKKIQQAGDTRLRCADNEGLREVLLGHPGRSCQGDFPEAEVVRRAGEPVIDLDWYAKNVGDPETGEQRRFTGGNLAPVDFELDALFYGVQWENSRRKHEHELLSVFVLMQLLGGDETVTGHRLDRRV